MVLYTTLVDPGVWQELILRSEIVCKFPLNLHDNVGVQHNNQSSQLSFACWSEGTDLMISESPGSMIDSVLTLKYFPQAVPKSTLSPE